MKTILIVEASPRKGFCTDVAEKIENQLKEIVQIQTLTLRNFNIGQCKGCCLCLTTGSSKCYMGNDDIQKILQRFLEADGIIFVVPNYALGVPAFLKNVFDRLAYLFHRPRLFHKICLPIVVEGVYGGKKIGKYINEVMGFWGMNPIKGVVVTGGVRPNEEKRFQISKKDESVIKKAIYSMIININKAKVKSPSIFKLMIFRMTRTSMKYSNEVLPKDLEYFKNRGWMESGYYYDVKLGVFKRLAGQIFDAIAKSMIKNVAEGRVDKP